MPAPEYLTISEFLGDGVTTSWEFNFAGGYISRDHVRAEYRNGEEVVPIPLSPSNFASDFTLVISPPIPAGATLRIFRSTPKEAPLVNFTGGSNFTEANLDLLARQTVFSAAEAFDENAYSQTLTAALDLAAASSAAQQAAASASSSAAAAAAAAASVPRSDQPYVILAMGQSNMRGFAPVTTTDLSTNPRVLMWDTDALNSPVVFGTQFRAAEYGVPPLNISVTPGVSATPLLSHECAKRLTERIGRPVYVVQIAAGGHTIEAFLRSATLTANGWTRPAGNQDLAPLVSQAGTALAAVPGSPSKYDAVIWHQGEANWLDSVEVYANKLTKLWDDLVFYGVVDRNNTTFVAGELVQSSGNSVRSSGTITDKAGTVIDLAVTPLTVGNLRRHWESLRRASIVLPNLRLVSTKGLGPNVAGGLHFDAFGYQELGRRYCEALVGGGIINDTDYMSSDVDFDVDAGFQYLMVTATSAAPSDRPGAPITAAWADYDLVSPLGRARFYTAATSNLVTTRRIYRVSANRLVRIGYEIQALGGDVSHRPFVMQWDKDFNPLGTLVSLPSPFVATAADGRVEVLRTFKRAGSPLTADTTLAAGCEYVSLGYNFGFTTDTRNPAWFNILEMSV